MSALSSLAGLPEMQIVGWTVLNALWQGAALGLLLFALLRASAGRSPRLRYALACAALGAMIALPLATASDTRAAWEQHERCWRDAGAGVHPLPQECLGHGLRPVEHAAGEKAEPLSDLLALSLHANRATGWIGAAWLLGVLLLLARAVVGWRGALRLGRAGTAPAPGELERTLETLAGRLGVRRPVALRVSSRVEVPTLAGWRAPVVLLPQGLAERIGAAEMEAILAHELAHVRRNDAAVNLLQVVLECLLFAHPAARWAAERVREEREACCDEAAVEALSGRVGAYLRALLALESLRSSRSARHVVAMSDGPLLDRARRLAERGAPPSRGGRGLLAALVLAAVLLLAAMRLPSGSTIAAWAIMTVDLQARAAATPPAHIPGR